MGTPLYVSPEMLHETKSLPASDLWALGCIIYRMHVGSVPFEDKSETGTFNKILNRELHFPPTANLSEATKDLIDKLLQVNPKKRLGAGKPGGPNDLMALKSHQYFAGIDFGTLAHQTSPLRDLDIPDAIVQDSLFVMRKSATIVQKEEQNLVVREGELKKRNEYRLKQTRLFCLTRDGLIKYYKDKMLHRGTILLCKNSRVSKSSKKSFEIKTPKRTWYLYEVETNTIDAWIRDIESVIATL